MYFVLSGAVTDGTGRKLVKVRRKCGDCLLVTTVRTPNFSKNKCPRPRSMWQPRSSRYHIHTQYSIASCNSNREYSQNTSFQCLLVAKTECYGLRKLDPLSTQAPSSCKHMFTFFECFVQSGSVSTQYQSLLCQCSLTCCGLSRSRQRKMSSPLHHL